MLTMTYPAFVPIVGIMPVLGNEIGFGSIHEPYILQTDITPNNVVLGAVNSEEALLINMDAKGPSFRSSVLTHPYGNPWQTFLTLANFSQVKPGSSSKELYLNTMLDYLLKSQWDIVLAGGMLFKEPELLDVMDVISYLIQHEMSFRFATTDKIRIQPQTQVRKSLAGVRY